MPRFRTAISWLWGVRPPYHRCPTCRRLTARYGGYWRYGSRRSPYSRQRAGRWWVDDRPWGNGPAMCSTCYELDGID